MRPFDKPALTYGQQVDLLRSRGMVIDDGERAVFYLQHLNYYRLCAYWLPFEADHASHQFKSGTRFEDVLDLYVFDRELRLIILDAIERIEVSVRSNWAYALAHLHGHHAHTDMYPAKDQDKWQRDLESLKEHVEQRNDEVFIQHHKLTYQEELPPLWVVCEVMTLGLLSRWYGNLKPAEARRAISSTYRLDEMVLQSWLHHLTVVRNICAHHGRLWNREFTITPKLPKRKPERLIDNFVPKSRRVYNSLVILLHFMDIVSPKHDWRSRLIQHLGASSANLTAMGFPGDWPSKSIWQAARS